MPIGALTTSAEPAARQAMRGQIERLERELAATLAATFPHLTAPRPIAHGGPRLLPLAELERTRDTLAIRVTDVRRQAEAQRACQAAARARLAAMYKAPADHKGEVVTNAELGLPGCTSYAVRPRLLGAWWRVKVSSGCP